MIFTSYLFSVLPENSVWRLWTEYLNTNQSAYQHFYFLVKIIMRLITFIYSLQALNKVKQNFHISGSYGLSFLFLKLYKPLENFNYVFGVEKLACLWEGRRIKSLSKFSKCMVLKFMGPGRPGLKTKE